MKGVVFASKQAGVAPILSLQMHWECHPGAGGLGRPSSPPWASGSPPSCSRATSE